MEKPYSNIVVSMGDNQNRREKLLDDDLLNTEMDEKIKTKKFKELNREIRNCKKCRLWETRTNALPGEGNIHAKLIMVAQAPGYEEDKEGRMFIGPSGKKLDELLEETGIARKNIFITNILRCMLPKYRKPKMDEIDICTPYLDREIELINPAIIATLGYFATRYIFEKYGIGEPEFPEICGEIFENDKKIFPLRHPAAILYNSSIQSEMTKNYGNLKKLVDSI